MPYAEKIAGIYKIVNTMTGGCYVGQSANLKKRLTEHRRLLRNGEHTNPHLQHSFDKYGEGAFEFCVEVRCDDVNELDMLENAFLSGDAHFEQPAIYNIARYANVPMRGKKHTEETKAKIRRSKRGKTDYLRSSEFREKLRAGQLRRCLEDEDLMKRVKFILENQDMSYSRRGRILGMGTSNVRRLALRYGPMKGQLPW